MSPQEAYKIIQKKYPVGKVLSCLDFGTFYGFDIAPAGEGKGYRSGPFVDAVDKKTGKVSIYNITSNPDLYLSAVPVNVKGVMDKTLSEVRRE